MVDRKNKTEPLGDGMAEHMEQMIGQHLKAMYDGVLAEPIPDRILALLEKLDTVSRQSKDEDK